MQLDEIFSSFAYSSQYESTKVQKLLPSTSKQGQPAVRVMFMATFFPVKSERRSKRQFNFLGSDPGPTLPKTTPRTRPKLKSPPPTLKASTVPPETPQSTSATEPPRVPLPTTVRPWEDMGAWPSVKPTVTKRVCLRVYQFLFYFLYITFQN